MLQNEYYYNMVSINKQMQTLAQRDSNAHNLIFLMLRVDVVVA